MKKIVCSLADSFDLSFDSFKLHCEVKGLSRGTVDWYLILLRTFRKYVEEADLAHSPSEVTPDAIRRYIRHIQLEKPKFNGAKRKDATNGLASKTVSGHVKTLKTFFGYLCSEGELAINPAAALASPKVKQQVIQTFTEQQIEALLAQPNKRTFGGYRTYALMLMLLDTGIRVSELAGLELGKVDLSAGFITVCGKGNKERQVPLGITMRTVLAKWLMMRNQITHADPYLFVARDGRQLKVRTIQDEITYYGEKAGIVGVRVSPHTFRHTFAKMWIMNGGDAFSLQKILGHTAMDMVRKYVNLATNDVAEQHRKFSPADRISRSFRKPF